jgi:hypothetical protein
VHDQIGPEPDNFYRHFKGELYYVSSIAKHTETGEVLVIYHPVSRPEEIYARPLESWNSPVFHGQHITVPRFVRED